MKDFVFALGRSAAAVALIWCAITSIRNQLDLSAAILLFMALDCFPIYQGSK